MVGDNADASSLFTTACVYGGPSNTLDACGAVNAPVDNGGVMAGAAYDFGNGLTASVGWAGDENDVANEEGVDAYGINFAYTADSYGVSLTYGVTEDGAPVNDNMEVDSFVAVNAYSTPDSDIILKLRGRLVIFFYIFQALILFLKLAPILLRVLLSP